MFTLYSFGCWAPCLSWRHRVAAALVAGSADTIGRLASKTPAPNAVTPRGNPVSPAGNLPTWVQARVYGTRRLVSGAEGLKRHQTGPSAPSPRR